ncbi:MAG: hypothetical protein ABEJ42_00125 [Halobacteriaceae archaeon]
MSVLRRFQGRQTQFHVELVYGLLFIAGFVFLVFRVDPRVAAFEGGLVAGYLLRIWEKMAIYERILEEAVSREAESQVEAEVEEQVADEVATELEEQVGEEVEQEVEEQVESEIGDLDAEIDERVSERLGESESADHESTGDAAGPE